MEGDRPFGRYHKRRVISTHALRMEGDLRRITSSMYRFSDFYPRPPHGGRQKRKEKNNVDYKFLPTPSAWRATVYCPLPICKFTRISTHALRMEGDVMRGEVKDQFGLISTHALRMEGDHEARDAALTILQFLPTPSAWRATIPLHNLSAGIQFLPTPSAWRATYPQFDEAKHVVISTHALRMEGDRSRL